jgi:Xaa-Pro aminopeptidase
LVIIAGILHQQNTNIGGEHMSTKADFAERDMRFRRIRQAMEVHTMDALVVAGRESNCDIGRGYFRYFTDYHLWGHDGLILIPLESEPVVTVPGPRLAERIGRLGWVTDVHSDPDLAPAIVDAMKEKGLTRGRVGIVGWRFILPVGTYKILTNGLPDVEFVNADSVMDRVRMVKSPLEILQNRELWEVAKAGLEHFVEALEPGKTQVELASEVLRALAAGGCRDTLIWIDGSLPPKDVPVTLDDVVACHVETPGESGHWCEPTVTCAFRDPTARELRLMDSELQAYEEVRRIAKPGVRVSEMAKTFERVLLDNGWTFASEQPLHNDLHGQGLDPVEWPVYGTSVQQDMVIEEGMVFNYHPRRVVHPLVRHIGINDNFVINADGAERLSGDWDLRWRRMG